MASKTSEYQGKRHITVTLPRASVPRGGMIKPSPDVVLALFNHDLEADQFVSCACTYGFSTSTATADLSPSSHCAELIVVVVNAQDRGAVVARLILECHRPRGHSGPHAAYRAAGSRVLGWAQSATHQLRAVWFNADGWTLTEEGMS